MITNRQNKSDKDNIELLGAETHTPLCGKEKKAMWDAIANATFKVKHRKKRWISTVAVAASIAACAVLAVLFGKQYNPREGQMMDIVLFAEQSSITSNDVNTTVLKLSDDNLIELRQRQSEIAYKFQEIYANLQKLEQTISANTYNQVIVPAGSQSFVSLEDGTMVWVNSGTVLFYPGSFDKDKREIYVNGEIYLDVAKDADRPFIVRAKGMHLEVKGTKFNVSAYNSKSFTSVLLVEGSVMVRDEGTESEFLLKPNELFENKSGNVHVKQVDPDYYISWVDGYYKYERQHLAEVIAHLAKYYDKKVACDHGVQRLKCSGKLYIDEDFNILLERLAEAMPITVELRGDTYYISLQTD